MNSRVAGQARWHQDHNLTEKRRVVPWQDYSLSWDSEMSVIGWNSSEVGVCNHSFENNTWYSSIALEFEQSISGTQKNLPIKQWKYSFRAWNLQSVNSQLKIPTIV